MEQDPYALIHEHERAQAEARASREFGDALRTMAARNRLDAAEPPPPDGHQTFNDQLRAQKGQSARQRSRAIEERMR